MSAAGTVEYRLVWEMRIPGGRWGTHERLGDQTDLRDQLEGLRQLEGEGEDVANPRLEMRTVGPWEVAA